MVTGSEGTRTDEWTSGRWWRPVGWVLAVSWLVLAVLVPSMGTKHATWDALVNDLADGVHSVEVEGEPRVIRGWSTQTIRWETGWLTHRVEVIEATSPRMAREGREQAGRWDTFGEPTKVVVGLEDELRIWSPDVELTHVPRESGAYSDIAGFRLPVWVGVFAMALGVTTFALLVSGPRPRRATRWAWFWIMASSPIGLAAYLVYGGPLGRRTAPATPADHITGGWGFLIAIVLGSLWGWAAS